MFDTRLTCSAKLVSLFTLYVAVLLMLAGPANAHQVWIDTDSTGKSNAPHTIEVCWGHSGERTSGEQLAGQRDKLSARVLGPDGKPADLNLSPRDDCFAATAKLGVAGCYVFGAELQTGILPRDFHGIPANTRIVMYGKTLTRVGNSEEGLAGTMGHDLEIVPLSTLGELRQGGVARAKLLFKGKPLGGKSVEISLVTPGVEPLPQHRRIQSHEWSISAIPDPYTGEVAFPLITAGKHTFFIRYTDETPGVYDGPRDDSSDFSHLRKGDTYERTLYMSTLAVWVNPE